MYCSSHLYLIAYSYGYAFGTKPRNAARGPRGHVKPSLSSKIFPRLS